MSLVRVFVIDGLAVVRQGLIRIAEGQPGMVVVGESDHLDGSCESISCLQPDIIIVDSTALGVNTSGAIRTLKEKSPRAKVLVLCMKPDAGQLREAIDAGALGYTCKQSSTAELVVAINAIVSGGIYIEPLLVHKLLPGADGHARARRKRSTELSVREQHVVRLIAQGHTNKEVASQLGISIKSVETYKARSAGKLGLQSRSDFVRYACDQGWLQPEMQV